MDTAKALTTKEDLSVGILEALDALPAAHLKTAEIISLSTTLATNACVEERGGSAKLVFFGGDRSVIDKYGREYGLPPSDEMYIQESYSTFSGGFEREPDWDLFRASLDGGFTGLDGVGVLEIYAMKNSAVVEKKAKELLLQKYDIPVVCGHELFNELNCLQRGASTLLNARLFPVIKEFIAAIKTAVAARGIGASIFIVRSDGSLMSDEFANVRPIETLLCGPAASVMGSARLSEHVNSVIVDMGGTTTDIALISGGVPVKAVGGARVGRWKTFVSGLYIKTFGLGGDSAVHYSESDIFLEDYRVVPLCVAAEKYPVIVKNLRALVKSGKKHMKYLHEHFILVKDIAGSPRYTDEEKAFCEALRAGPKILREAAESVPGRDIFNYNAARLIKEGVVQSVGLTPTDVMHIRGDYARFNAEASLLGAQYAALNAGITVDELCRRVYDEVKRKLYVNIVKALLENKESRYMKNGVGADIERLINDSYYMASNSRAQNSKLHKFTSFTFTTDYILTGVGAPIHIFLSDVAAALGTRAVNPEHYEVANALGAIVGSVYATNTVEIRPNYSAAGVTGYTVSGGRETKTFKSAARAEEFAAREAKKGARAEAVRRGAKGRIGVTCSLDSEIADTGEYRIHLATRAVAHAIGSFGI